MKETNRLLLFIGISLLSIIQISQVSGFDSVYTRLKAFPLKGGEDVGVPLLLTPLIENGQIDVARKLALVRLEDADNVESYSGYLTVDKTHKSNMFFWFFPALFESKNAPVLLWLQGGPGATSLFGLFTENGPFVISKNKSLLMRKYSWHIGHNLIYIDNPVGTGYSFTADDEGYSRDEAHVGKNLYNALLQFFQLFPELQKNDFYATGESYAGKYVPALSRTIKDMNAINAQLKINLKGLAIGNGLTDPVNQLNYGDYLYQIGLIDAESIGEFHKVERATTDAINKGDYKTAHKTWYSIIIGYGETPSLFKNITGFDFIYNYLKSESKDKTEWYLAEFIQSPATRKAIHVGNSTFHVGDTGFAAKVALYLANDTVQSQAENIQDLLKTHRVLIYSGQLDIVVAYPLTENYLLKLEWPGPTMYNTVKRKKWFVEGELAGYSRQFDNFTEIFVRNAGHMVPADQAHFAFDMISRFTHNYPF